MSSLGRTLLLACLLSLPALGPAAHTPSRSPESPSPASTRPTPQAAQKFYGSTLGFERKEADDMWLYPVNHSQWIEILTTPPPPQPNVRLAAVAFTTDRRGPASAAISKPTTSSRMIPLKDGQFGVRDPEGNLVIFVQRDSEKLVARALASSLSHQHPHHPRRFHRHRSRQRRRLLAADPRLPSLLARRTQRRWRHNWVSLQVPDGTDWLEYMLNAGPNPTLHQTGVMDHFSLGVTHMNDAVAALARNHCEGPNCTKTQMGRDGKVQLNLFDPDQTRVEFMEFAPAQEPCCSPFTAKHPSAGDRATRAATSSGHTLQRHIHRRIDRLQIAIQLHPGQRPCPEPAAPRSVVRHPDSADTPSHSHRSHPHAARSTRPRSESVTSPCGAPTIRLRANVKRIRRVELALRIQPQHRVEPARNRRMAACPCTHRTESQFPGAAHLKQYELAPNRPTYPAVQHPEPSPPSRSQTPAQNLRSSPH